MHKYVNIIYVQTLEMHKLCIQLNKIWQSENNSTV